MSSRRFLLAVILLLPAICSPKDFVPGMGDDLHELFSRDPLIVMGTGAVATGAAFLIESPCGNPGFMGDGFLHQASVVSHHTMGLPLLGVSAVLWGAGSLGDSPRTEETGQMLTEGLLLTYGLTGVLKLGTGRERPDGSNSRSFPSAHSAGTACAAVILWDRYGAGAGIPAAAVSVFTALSRVHMGRHYPSDVIAGAAIGLSVGLAVTRAHGEADSPYIHPALGIRWSSENGFGVYF
jgi:hypothetical protein